MAYSSHQHLYDDGNKTIYIAGANSIKDLAINDLTIPLRLSQYTDRHKQSHQLFDSNKDKIRNIISHSLGSVIAHHTILEHEHLNGPLYSTPSLARPHERIEYVSQYGDPIVIFHLGINTLYLGNTHTYTGYSYLYT
jgi:hypothetical protein